MTSKFGMLDIGGRYHFLCREYLPALPHIENIFFKQREKARRAPRTDIGTQRANCHLELSVVLSLLKIF